MPEELNLEVRNGEVIGKVDYGLYGVKDNPFPISAIAIDGAPFPLYSPHAVETVTDFIERTYEENEFGMLLVAGDYGFGKTYLLRWIEREINARYSQRNNEAACAVYVENPLSSPRELVSSMISHFGTNKFLTMIWMIVSREFRKKYEEEGKTFLSQFQPSILGLYDKDFAFQVLSEEMIENPMVWMRHLIDNLAKRGMFDLDKYSEFSYSVLREILSDTTLTQELCRFTRKERGKEKPEKFADLFSKWCALMEFKIPQKGFYVAPDDTTFMKRILGVFKRSGFKRVYWLIDEFEDIEYTLSSEKLTVYLRTLRTMIDSVQDSLNFVIALKPSAVKATKEAYGGFFERIGIFYRLDLAGIMENALEKFVADILKNAREEDLGISPFTKDGLKQIYEYTGPNPRLILQVCSELFFQAAKEKRKYINRDFVNNFYAFGKPSAWTEPVWVTKKAKERMEKEK